MAKSMLLLAAATLLLCPSAVQGKWCPADFNGVFPPSPPPALRHPSKHCHCRLKGATRTRGLVARLPAAERNPGARRVGDTKVSASDLLVLLSDFARSGFQRAGTHRGTIHVANPMDKCKGAYCKMCTGDISADGSLDVVDLLQLLQLFDKKYTGKCRAFSHVPPVTPVTSFAPTPHVVTQCHQQFLWARAGSSNACLA